MNIYEKINAIMGEIKSLQKDGKIAYGSTKYSYLSEAKTTETIRDPLVRHKLVLLPIRAEETKEGQITHGTYTYRLVNAENPEEYIDLMACGQGHDTADKGSGKASCYAYKYLIWRTFALPSNDDPDQISSEEISDMENEAIRKNAEKKRAQKNEFEAAQNRFFDIAKKCGYKTAAQAQELFTKKTGIEFFLAKPNEINDFTDRMEKAYAKKQEKQSV